MVLVGYAIPGFVLGVFLIVLFAGGTFLDWFPLRGLTSTTGTSCRWPARIADYFWHLTLPLICLVIGSFAVVTMLTKNTFVEEIRKQYVLVARAKGLSQRAVLYKHIFRNALIPLVTGFPAAFVGAFFAGSVLIETLFSLDGLGPAVATRSVVRRDYPVVLGSLYLFTLIGLVVKLVSRPAVRGGRPARAVRRGRQMSAARRALDEQRAAAARRRRLRRRPARPMSPNQRAWARFRRNRIGLVSLWIFGVLLVLATCRRAAQQRPAAGRALRRRAVLPAVQQPARERPSAATSPPRPTGRTRSSPSASQRPGNWALLHAEPAIGRARINYFDAVPSPAPPSARQLARHRRPRAATWWRGCSTAFASASGSRWR